MKEKIFGLFKNIYGFCVKLAKDRVGIYTAQASFFIILSIFPFILLFLNVLGSTTYNPQNIISFINNYSPNAIKPLLVQIIQELYTHASGTMISVSAVIAIWSASKGVLSVMFGLYEISKIHQERNYFISRFISMIYTVIFIISLIITMILLVFGNRIIKHLIAALPWLADIKILTLIFRYLITFIILTFFFTIIYRIANMKLTSFKKVIPGSLFSSLGWIIFSYVFSIYVDNFSNMSYMYGSLTAVIVFMIWIYFCIYILLIGAEINKLLYPETEAVTSVSL